MSPNLLDFLLVAGFLVAAVRGARQGALAQVLTFGGAALGTIAGTALAPPVAAEFIGGPGPTLSLVTLGIVLGFLVLGQAVGFAAGLRLRMAAERAGHGSVDRAAGVVVGLGGLLIIVWLVGSALVQGPLPSVAHQIRNSHVIAVVDEVLPPPPDIVGRVGTFLDQQGFPQVFAGLGGATAPPVDPPTQGAVAAATQAGAPSTVQVQALGCGGISSGSGFVVAPGFVVTNAHVVAGGESLTVRDRAGTHEAVTIHVDPDLDLALVSSPGAVAPPIAWATTPADRGVQGATLGYPGGQRELNVRPAAVRSRIIALGRDIYGRGVSQREILTLSSAVAGGDSGGPFVTAAGQVAGVVFAASTSEGGVGYALTAEQVRPDVDAAIAANTAVPTGPCRF